MQDTRVVNLSNPADANFMQTMQPVPAEASLPPNELAYIN